MTDGQMGGWYLMYYLTASWSTTTGIHGTKDTTKLGDISCNTQGSTISCACVFMLVHVHAMTGLSHAGVATFVFFTVLKFNVLILFNWRCVSHISLDNKALTFLKRLEDLLAKLLHKTGLPQFPT